MRWTISQLLFDGVDAMSHSIIKADANYKAWLKGIKQSFAQTQLKAAVSVNTALLEFYWQLGGEIVEKQKNSQWGEGFLTQLSQDLTAEFPDIKGFSKRNLWAIRQWYLFYSGGSAIVQQAVAQLAQIPWGHNLVIVSKCQTTAEALYYVQNTHKQLKTEHDNPSIGLLLCKEKDKLVAEYALTDVNKPIGISEYQLTQALPDNLKSSLTSIEEIEAELARGFGDE